MPRRKTLALALGAVLVVGFGLASVFMIVSQQPVRLIPFQEHIEDIVDIANGQTYQWVDDNTILVCKAHTTRAVDTRTGKTSGITGIQNAMASLHSSGSDYSGWLLSPDGKWAITRAPLYAGTTNCNLVWVRLDGSQRHSCRSVSQKSIPVWRPDSAGFYEVAPLPTTTSISYHSLDGSSTAPMPEFRSIEGSIDLAYRWGANNQRLLVLTPYLNIDRPLLYETSENAADRTDTQVYGPASDNTLDIAMSPDGRRLAWISGEFPARRPEWLEKLSYMLRVILPDPPYTQSIVVTDIDGKNPRTVINNIVDDETRFSMNSAYQMVTWCPDSKSISYVANGYLWKVAVR